MARLSRQRRALAKLTAASAQVKVAKSLISNTEMAMLQQGSPRNNSRAKFDNMTGLAQPMRPLGVEGQGKVKRAKDRPAAKPRARIEWQHDETYIERLKADYLVRGGKI